MKNPTLNKVYNHKEFKGLVVKIVGIKPGQLLFELQEKFDSHKKGYRYVGSPTNFFNYFSSVNTKSHLPKWW